MKYRCPRCGWEWNGYGAQYCEWCGQQLPSLQEVTRFEPETLDERMKKLKWDIQGWIMDVRECFQGRGIENEWNRKLVRDFALWFMDIAGIEKSLFYEEKTLENQTENTENNCNNKADSCKNNSCLSKPNRIFVPTRFLCSFAAGVWTVILIQIAIRLVGYLCGIG